MADKQNLLLLFEHPQEPVFIRKGPKNSVFIVPSNFLAERFQNIGIDLSNRFLESADEQITVKDNVTIPDLKVPMSFGRREQFSLHFPSHRRFAAALIDIFMKLETIEELLTVAVYARDRLNPFLFNFSFTVALLHRPDTKDLDLPTYAELFPEKYVDSRVFSEIREQATVTPEESRIPVVIPRDYTASDLEPEHRLWYFREDIGVNIHHWHWHIVYPFEANDKEIVAKDRRGELFYYMHQQMLERYNFERFCNNLPRVKSFFNFREPIEEGYFPKMDSFVVGRPYPPRPASTSLKDLNRPIEDIKNTISDMEQLRDRFIEACHQGYVVDSSGNKINLDEFHGIDILANIIESSMLSVNRELYGDLHNMGHEFISCSHDPDYRHLEGFGVMGDIATEMRDPVFYRWHAFIDDLFQEHKERLTPYTTQQLDFPGVIVNSATVQLEESKNGDSVLQTFWQQTDVDFSRGLDFIPRGNVFARFTHLQHQPFSYNININNNNGAQVKGTCRIFMAPSFDESGNEMLMKDKRRRMIEMDRFVVRLTPGENIIRRRSTESSITLPFERTFRNLQRKKSAGEMENLKFSFCGCGWPQHMLIPKGTTGQGLQCDLFVMVSNYEEDRIEQNLMSTCNDAESFCGVRDRLYPDIRAMGYPFDRSPRQGAEKLQQFLTPNMNVSTVHIVHTEQTTSNPNNIKSK